MFNVFAIGALINAALMALLGFFILLKNTDNKGNRIFFLLTISMVFWALNFGVWQTSQNAEFAILFLRLLMIGAIFIPIFYIHYIYYFLGSEKKNIILLILGYILTFVFAYFDYFTDLVVAGIYPVKYFGVTDFNYWPYGGTVFHIWLAWFCVVLAYGMHLLRMEYINTKGARREQAKYFFIAALVCFLGGLTIFPLWYHIDIPPIGIWVVFIYPAIFAYSITKYRFLDIRFIVGRGLIYLASIITVVASAFILYGANGLAGNIVPLQFVWPIIMVVGIMAYPATFAFYEYLASKFFYYTIYEYQKVFSDLASKLSKVLDLAKLSELFMDTIMETMKLEKASLVLVNGSNFEVVSARGFDYPKIGAVVKSDFIISYAKKTLLPFSREEFSMLANALRYSPSEQEKIIGAKILLEKIGVSLIVPMYMEDRLTGLLVLGDKISGAHFSEQDVETLRDLSLHAAVAFENARNYSMAQVAAKKLEEQVRLRTKELRATNEQLKKIDQEKSDFVALASYHLRTPLTVIKSYIASVISGEGGAVPEQMQRPLRIVQDSNENLIEFTNELLDVTRVESGTMEMKLEELDLAKMIGEIVGQLEQRAKEKGLELVFEKPSEPLPPIMADRLKLEQVIFNILDNAVKYTNKGSVIAKLEKRANKQVITVADTGEGMTHEEVLNIFEKFTRGESGPKSQTKGSGIGLYIAKKFIEMHKGKIMGESRGQGLGSTFTIEIPYGKSK
ncbi:MAG: ATP-binding protein [Candidatus Paceibacterota bacterium]